MWHAFISKIAHHKKKRVSLVVGLMLDRISEGLIVFLRAFKLMWTIHPVIHDLCVGKLV